MGSFVQLENAVRPEGVKIHRPIRLPKTRPILPPTERLAGGKIRRTCRNSREGGYGSLPGIVDKPGLPDWIIRRFSLSLRGLYPRTKVYTLSNPANSRGPTLTAVPPPARPSARLDTRVDYRGPTDSEDRHANTQAYIESTRPRYVQLARVLKKTGSFYYHYDGHAAYRVQVIQYLNCHSVGDFCRGALRVRSR